MKIVKVNPRQLEESVLAEMVSTLKRGGVIIYPTETSYGLGVGALDPEAVEKVYRSKGRDYRKPLSVMVSGAAMAEKYVEVTLAAKKIFSRLLPGPLTLVLRKKGNVPDVLTGGAPTLGLRYPDYPLVQQILNKFGFPFTATSANPSGDLSLYDVSDLSAKFGSVPLSLIDLVIDAGPLPPRPPSTVLDLTASPPKILRPGPITAAQIEVALGQKIAS